MADKKISQLTGAATPLSGTEVLPIVQSGATVKVAVSDLTAGRAVATSGLTVTSGALVLTGNQSAAAWTTNGINIKGGGSTLTDTSSSGTVAAAYTDVLGGNTIAASNVTTFTDYSSMFISPPTPGTNVTFTNAWALGLGGSLTVAGRSLTGAQATSAINVTQTWNTTGAPTALKVNITNTASDAAALLMDLQVGGVSYAKIDKNANIVHLGTITSNPGGTYSRILNNTGLQIVHPANTSASVRFTQSGVQDWSISNVATTGNLSFGGKFIVTPAGNLQLGTASLATNATNGFPYIPTCAGTPTGTPTAITGYAPMVVDSTNNKLYVYVGGAWVAMN